MLVNSRQSRNWMIGCSALFVIAVAVYLLYAMGRPRWPGGGSVIGLVYGSVGTAMMLFALLLGLRKRFRSVRIGRAKTWLQGHVWLGIISYPIIVLHAGFHVWGSPMGMTLMLLFTVVFVSGIVGLVVQQYLPTEMIRDVPGETIYEQIDHVLHELREEARKQVLLLQRQEEEEEQMFDEGGMTMTVPRAPAMALGVGSFYTRAVAPYLLDRIPGLTPFASAESTNTEFRRVALRLPPESRAVLDRLHSIVDERRQLAEQRHLYVRLHCWLLVHVPISYGLMILVPVHAILAVRYGFVGH